MLNRRRFVLLSFVIAAVAAGGVAYRQHKRYKHLAIHDPGMVYRSAWLEADAFRAVIEKYQIRAVLNLCEPDEMGAQRCIDERAAVSGSGAKLIELPMPAATLDPADPAIENFVKILGDPENYPLLVHCQHGVTRTAKVLAMYDIVHRHLSAEESIGRMPLFGRDSYSVSVTTFAHNFEQQYRELYPQAAGKLETLRR